MKPEFKTSRVVFVLALPLFLAACASGGNNLVVQPQQLSPQQQREHEVGVAMNTKARETKQAWCLRYFFDADRTMKREQFVVASNQISDEKGDWTCLDYSSDKFVMRQSVAVAGSSAVSSAGAVNAAATGESILGKGLVGIEVKQSADTRFLLVNGLTPGGAAESSGMVKAGDTIIGIRQEGSEIPDNVATLSLGEAVAKMRGEPDTTLYLTVLPAGGFQTTEVALVRRVVTPAQLVAIRKQKVGGLAQQGNGGSFMSPYTSDGVTAEWVDKAINVSMGGATGSVVGAAAGAYAANKVLENVPFGGMLGGMLGSKAGKAVGASSALDASGGMAFVKSSSDISFNSLQNMAAWLVEMHGDKGNFTEVIAAADKIYPGLQNAVVAAAN